MRLDQRWSKSYQPVGTSAGIVAAYILESGLEIQPQKLSGTQHLTGC